MDKVKSPFLAFLELFLEVAEDEFTMDNWEYIVQAEEGLLWRFLLVASELYFKQKAITKNLINRVIDLEDEIDNKNMTIDERIEKTLLELTDIEVKFSKNPTITEKAGFFKRRIHLWKMKDYEDIASKEAGIASNRHKAANEILQQIKEASLFVREISDKDDEFSHSSRMRKLTEAEKNAEVRIKEMEAKIKEMEAEQLKAEISRSENFRARRHQD
jgi:hypothetical protein